MAVYSAFYLRKVEIKKNIVDDYVNGEGGIMDYAGKLEPREKTVCELR